MRIIVVVIISRAYVNVLLTLFMTAAVGDHTDIDDVSHGAMADPFDRDLDLHADDLCTRRFQPIRLGESGR